MLDVAIIGGGLCGLALAHSLQAREATGVCTKRASGWAAGC